VRVATVGTGYDLRVCVGELEITQREERYAIR
jgi:hypothetical protein